MKTRPEKPEVDSDPRSPKWRYMRFGRRLLHDILSVMEMTEKTPRSVRIDLEVGEYTVLDFIEARVDFFLDFIDPGIDRSPCPVCGEVAVAASGGEGFGMFLDSRCVVCGWWFTAKRRVS